MLKFFKKIVKQYITCKHERKTTERECIFTVEEDNYGRSLMYDRFRCDICKRKLYSKYYIMTDKRKIYFK